MTIPTSTHSQLDTAVDIGAACEATGELLRIMARLRDPQGGCPWDLAQDFSTIAPYTIEEAYEVADAIERDAMDELLDELGDLLLQVVFHAQMAAERQLFDFRDVVRAISSKMLRRHPHVFADGNAADAEAVARTWEQIKAQERAAKRTPNAGDGADPAEAGALDGVPRGLPSLLRAAKVQRRAAGVGFDWPDVSGVIAKAREELDELESAMAADDVHGIRDELGDVLFSVSNLARHLKLDAEASLRSATAKFEARFAAMERLAREVNEDFASLGLEKKEALWKEVKSKELLPMVRRERSEDR